jgi:NAD(P) transhydrogenase subunit alpha
LPSKADEKRVSSNRAVEKNVCLGGAAIQRCDSGKFESGLSRGGIDCADTIAEEDSEMNSSSSLINALFIFVLAGFIGFEVIRRVSPLLHTPLMSLTNALDAIAVVGAIVLVGEHKSSLSAIFGFIAVVAATSNIVGGFLITDRMLKMFKSSRPAAKTAAK